MKRWMMLLLVTLLSAALAAACGYRNGEAGMDNSGDDLAVAKESGADGIQANADPSMAETAQAKEVLLYRIAKGLHPEASSEVVIGKQEEIDVFVLTVQTAVKQPGPGVVKVKEPHYRFELNQKAYYLWLDEAEQKGWLMHEDDTHHLHTIAEEQIPGLLAIISRSYPQEAPVSHPPILSGGQEDDVLKASVEASLDASGTAYTAEIRLTNKTDRMIDIIADCGSYVSYPRANEQEDMDKICPAVYSYGLKKGDTETRTIAIPAVDATQEHFRITVTYTNDSLGPHQQLDVILVPEPEQEQGSSA